MSSVLLKKPTYAIRASLSEYLRNHSRAIKLPLSYTELLNFSQSINVYDQKGKDTLWETVFYEPALISEIHDKLKQVYSLLKFDGESKSLKHLSIDKIDYCTFGNSKPFRIKVINNINDNHDYFYVKQADASRVFGLELEELLSPNRVIYLAYEKTLIEEHIVGIPGDQFIEINIKEAGHNEVRLAKEFVKFNERSYRRLLGDMRSYNFIIDITPDFDQIQYRLRAIDFDQQSYEGRRSFYLPHYFKENLPYVNLGIKHLSAESVEQYQKEERSAIARRIYNDKTKLHELLNSMKKHELTTVKKFKQLQSELIQKESIPGLADCDSPGSLLSCLLQDLIK
jgi:hypothetical protein